MARHEPATRGTVREFLAHATRFAPARLAIMVFLSVICLTALCLSTPWATAEGKRTTIIDAAFTATSAVSVTGLTTVSTAEHWSTFGQVVIMIAIGIGGLGVMTLGALLTLITSRKLGLTQKLLTASETRSRLGDVATLVRTVGVTALSCQLALMAILAPRFLIIGDSTREALWHAAFYSVSTFNNAGFIPTPEGLTPFGTDIWVMAPIILGVFIGALGFPVILNVAQHFRRPSRWTLHTKLTIATSLALLVIGPVLIAVTEWNNPATLGQYDAPGAALNALFVGTMTRSGGFASVDIGQMHASTLVVQDALMFIGGGSSSTAGGIKVTTMAVLLLAIVAEARGDRDIEAFGRRIDPGILRVAVTVVVATTLTLLVGVLILLTITDGSLDQVLFECISAFATCGLTTGLTQTLPTAGKLTLMALMLVGRLGTMTLAAALAIRDRRRVIRLPQERPIIG